MELNRTIFNSVAAICITIIVCFSIYTLHLELESKRALEFRSMELGYNGNVEFEDVGGADDIEEEEK